MLYVNMKCCLEYSIFFNVKFLRWFLLIRNVYNIWLVYLSYCICVSLSGRKIHSWISMILVSMYHFWFHTYVMVFKISKETKHYSVYYIECVTDGSSLSPSWMVSLHSGVCVELWLRQHCLIFSLWFHLRFICQG